MEKSNNPQIKKLRDLIGEYKKEMWAGNTRNGFHIYCQIVELQKELGLPISLRQISKFIKILQYNMKKIIFIVGLAAWLGILFSGNCAYKHSEQPQNNVEYVMKDSI